MRSLRLLITFWLCLSLPYAALASALRDPQCVAGQSMAVHQVSEAMSMNHAAHAMPAGMKMDMPMSAMHHSHDHSVAGHSQMHGHSHCSCILSCACSHTCATSGCAATYRPAGSDLAMLLTQESPRSPITAAQRAASPSELLRPPTRHA